MNAGLFFILLMLSAFVWAQPRVAKDVLIDTHWKGDVLVDRDIFVHKNATLFIEPGTKVLFKAGSDARRSGKSIRHVELIVLGRIIAEGREGNGKILFTSSAKEGRMNDWYGIILKSHQKALSRFRYCTIEYAYKGISCYASSPRITDCELQFNQYAGISCEVRARPYIRRSILFGNDFAGVASELSSYPLIEQCVISQNGNGVIIFDESKADLGFLKGPRRSSVGENLIFNNHKANIHNHSRNKIYAQNNIWHTEDHKGIEKTLFDQKDHNIRGKVIFQPVFGNVNYSKHASKRSSGKASQVVNSGRSRRRVAEVISVSNRQNWRKLKKRFSEARKTRTSVNKNVKASKKLPTKKKRAVVPEKQYDIPKKLNEALLNSPLAVRTKNIRISPAGVNHDAKAMPEKSAMAGVSAPERPAIDLDQPLLEAFLDNGAREYIRRIKPKYPSIYLRTKHEGKVLVEVIVGKKGRVNKYKILKSDGKYFTKAAVEALKTFHYKVGTYKNTPVFFKVIEPFYFKLEE